MQKRLDPGSKISHYRIHSLIGSGGMGEVYLAEDTRLDRQVALKILPEELASESDRIHRFLAEAKSASAVKHPNVAHIYDVGEEQGLRYIAMEYIDGKTLSDTLRATDANFNFVLDTAIQMADALDEAHASGIVHRDLKPANIMITRRGQLKILDFGLARVSKPVPEGDLTNASTRVGTSPGIVLGTVPYMSPEQVLGKPVDARSDLFSFGVILYQMLAGRLPFGGNNTTELMNSILNKNPEPLSRFNFDVPLELERIIRKCLEKNPEERYQSARDVLIDLRTLKRDTQSTPATEINRLAKRRHVARPVFIGFSILLFVIVSIVAVRILRSSEVRSIAVLPFENISKNPDMEYLSEGIPETLINRLAKIDQLTVISRTSSFVYNTQPVDIKKVGRELNVQAVLTGHLKQHGDNLAVGMELVDVKTNRQIWGEKYEQRLSNILSLQEEISRAVVRNLEVKIKRQAEESPRYTENSEAFNLYLKGRYYWNKATAEGAEQAIEYYQQAIDKDPVFALAYAGLAEVYGLYLVDVTIRPLDSLPFAKQAAQKALEIDPGLSEPKTVEAVLAYTFDHDFQKSEERFKQSIAANPNYAIAHHQYGWCLLFEKKFDQAAVEFEKAQQLDPLFDVFNADVTTPYLYSGRYSEALNRLEKAKKLHQNSFLLHWYYGVLHSYQGNYPLALKSMIRATEIDRSPINLGMLGYAYAKNGNRSEAEEVLAELESLSEKRYVSPYHKALIHLGLNREKEALAMLRKAYEERDMFFIYGNIDRAIDPLRKDKEFQELYGKIFQ